MIFFWMKFENSDNYKEHSIVHTSTKTETELATDDAATFVVKFTDELIALNLSQKKTDTIFKLTKILVQNLCQFNSRLINDSNDIGPEEVIESTTNFIIGKLEKLDSAYKRSLANSLNKRYVQPEECAIGTRWELKKYNDKNGQKYSIPNNVQNQFQYVSIPNTVQTLFTSEKFCQLYFNENTVLDHRCENGKYMHFCCGEAYKKNPFFQENPLGLQIHLASDDFEIFSPLQSKSGIHKICAIYFTIQNLPAKYLSKVDNIYLVALCNANDLKSKTTDFNNLWQKIVFDLKHLEEIGIEIDRRPNLKGTVTHLSFDNLGANFALGFVSSFVATNFCRHCIRPKDECRTAVTDDLTFLRTKELYDMHWQIIQNSEKVDYENTKGMKYYCKLNELSHFHILDNPSADIMHDLAEGVVPFLMKDLFVRAFEKKIFSETQLNWMVQYYDYGWISRRNKPSMINLSKRSLGQNAAQSLCLFRHLPFILHQYRNNSHLKEIWVCVTSLLKVVEIMHSYKLNDKHIQILKIEISTHLSSIKIHFKVHLRPKHHFMLHYPLQIQTMGPIVYLSMYRFESKHQQIKRFIGDNRNFRNINKTLAIKTQQISCNSSFTYTDEIQVSKIELVDISLFEKCQFEFDEQKQIFQVKWLRINDYEYMKNLLFIHEYYLYQIKFILLIANEYVLIGKLCNICEFDTFLNCFEIELNDVSTEISVNVSAITNKKTFELKTVNEKQYIIAATIDSNKEDTWN